MRNFILTSESVTAGHPDKLCDRISDAMVDACLAGDARQGCVAECAVATGVVFLSLRHGGTLDFDPAALARRVVAEAGYPEAAGARTTVVLDAVATPELAGPEAAGRALAGQMATVFGYACDHTEERMPWPIWAAHRVARALEAAGRHGGLGWLLPDAGVQVAVRFEDRRPVALGAVAVTLHGGDGAPEGEALAAAVRAEVLGPALAGAGLAFGDDVRVVVRRLPGPGGPATHSGLTGRKAATDGYGGFVRQGSSALSGKDPSRIDRTAAYAARQAAVSAVAAGLARECEVQLSYVAGDAGPVSLETDSFGTGTVPDEEITALLGRAIDFRAGAIAERLGLWELPRAREGRFYRELAAYGQAGRPELDLPWDRPVPLG